jgi:hypothetical protein
MAHTRVRNIHNAHTHESKTHQNLDLLHTRAVEGRKEGGDKGTGRRHFTWWQRSLHSDHETQQPVTRKYSMPRTMQQRVPVPTGILQHEGHEAVHHEGLVAAKTEGRESQHIEDC